MELRASQTDLVHDLFVRTADENYITARWCAVNRLNTDFLWLGVHALEKYLKAMLVLNGRSSKGYGHNIVKLYAKVKPIAGQLLPDRLQKPQRLDIDHWIERSAKDFVAHLLRQGNAHNRYLIYGYVMHRQDLYMLDQMVFAVRRLICPLDERAFPSRVRSAPTITNRERLVSEPEYYSNLYMPLDELIHDSETSPARKAALNLNTAFAPPDFTHTPVCWGSSFHNAVIFRRILNPLQSGDPRSAAEGVMVAQWFLNNVEVPQGKRDDPGLAE
jgi:hypothetical protein